MDLFDNGWGNVKIIHFGLTFSGTDIFFVAYVSYDSYLLERMNETTFFLR